MSKNFSSSYDNRIVHKPWGQEYTIFRNKNLVAITLLNIKYKHKTSLHCHPTKKTGFIILNGTAQVQLGIYNKNKKKYKSLSSLVIRPGLFHSLKATSKKGLMALEFESPVNKKDLIRYEDEYGREKKPYEDLKSTKKLNSKILKFKKPTIGKVSKYKLKDLEISLQFCKNLNNYSDKNKSISAILDGKMINKKGQSVIKYGEIVKTTTLQKLSKKFKIHNKMLILKVRKINEK